MATRNVVLKCVIIREKKKVYNSLTTSAEEREDEKYSLRNLYHP